MKYLVSGGAGFIGSHVVGFLLNEGHEVIIVDDFSSGKESNISSFRGSVTCTQGCITDESLLLKLGQGIDGIFHFAARVSVEESFKVPRLYSDINERGTLNIIKSAIKNAVKRIVFSSSCCVYGNGKHFPLSEASKIDLISPYAKTKHNAEKLGVQLLSGLNIDFFILRYFNVFGPKQNANTPYSGVISRFCEAVVCDTPISIFGDGKQTRDFIFINDVVKATCSLMGSSLSGTHIFNCCSSSRTSLLEVIDYLEKNIAHKITKNFLDKKAADISDSLGSNKKLKTHIDWDVEWSIGEGIRETLNWFICKKGQQLLSIE